MPDYHDLLPLTPDLNAERLETLKRLLPDLFTNEGRLNPDELRRLADPDGTPETERYEFRWFGKTLAKRTAFTPSNATLVRSPLPHGEGPGVGSFIIEGENLEVLKLLLAAYRQRVKCIYIDPPYNTGKDFVYSDNYTEDRRPYWENTGVTQHGVKIDTNTDADGRYHSNWLNMLYSRLLLARQLLRPDGVIFISIDDNEVTNLRKLCDEVFGEENFVANLVWQKKYGPANDAKQFSATHEHIVCYGKHAESWIPNLFDRSDEQLTAFKNPDNDLRGLWRASDLSARTASESCIYPIIGPTGKEFMPPKSRSWIISKSKFEEMRNDNRIIFGADGNGRPMQKKFLSEVKEGITPQTWWDRDFAGDNKTARYEMKELFPENIFDTPKPSSLIKRCVEISTSFDQNDLILDFFAGSGTTGQAVMELNAEDGGNRQFILVQIPEATDEASEAHKAGYRKISDITIERCRRVAARLASGKEASAGKARPAPETTLAQPTLFSSESRISADGTDFTDEKETDGENNLSAKSGSSVSSAIQDNPAGFQVLRLRQSYFPRTEWTPDPAKSDAENEKSLREYIRLKESQLVTLFNHGELISEILLKQGFLLDYRIAKAEEFVKNDVFRCTDGEKEALVCLDNRIYPATVELLFQSPPPKFICLERTLDTTQKWNLKHTLQERFHAF